MDVYIFGYVYMCMYIHIHICIYGNHRTSSVKAQYERKLHSVFLKFSNNNKHFHHITNNELQS